jgi:hypothetical protein
MAKRIKPIPMEVELKKRLDEQDRTMEVLNRTMQQVLDLLKGSSVMNTPGLIKTFQDFEVKLEDHKKSIAYFERWWELQKMKKGTFTFRTANLLTRSLSIIGGIAATAGIIYTVIQIVEHIKNL